MLISERPQSVPCPLLAICLYFRMFSKAGSFSGSGGGVNFAVYFDFLGALISSLAGFGHPYGESAGSYGAKDSRADDQAHLRLPSAPCPSQVPPTSSFESD